MGNRVSNIMTALMDGLAAVPGLCPADGTGTFKRVVNRLVNPLTEPVVPVLGIIQDRLARQGGTEAAPEWELSVLTVIGTRGKDMDAAGLIDQAIADLDAALTTIIAAGNLGGVVDKPDWDYWITLETLAKAGAMGQLRVRFSGPLKTS